MKARWWPVLPLVGTALTLAAMVAWEIATGSRVPRGEAGAWQAASATAAQSLGIAVAVSRPANGTHFVAGQAPALTITLNDGSGKPLARGDFATLNLYMYGPQDMAKTKTALKLLNASADRTQTPHHYVDLLTSGSVAAGGTALSYQLRSVSDEEPGTYTVALWAVKKDAPLEQTMELVDVQIGTATPERHTVDKARCATCHQGAASGKFYFRHIDPSRSPAGNWALDSDPIRTCKACHNNDGYAAYQGDADNPAAPAGTRTADPIVRRVHGVHMGEHLSAPFNIDPVRGDFRDYAEVIFPADARDCSACHVDDRFKTQPSRQACGACHDKTWFGDEATMPPGRALHTGGTQTSDQRCSRCHPAEGIAEAHAIRQLMNAVDVSMTPPRNGTFYVAGESPLVTMVIKDDAGAPIDHTRVDVTNFSTAGLFVSGNRARTVPVLTGVGKYGSSKLRASVSSRAAQGGGWTFAPGDTFKVAVNTAPPIVLAAPAGFQTPNQVRDWLAASLSGVTVTASATSVTIRSDLQGESSRIDIYDSPVTATMGWKPAGTAYSRGMTAGVTMEPYVNVGRASYPTNDLRRLTDPLDWSDPAVTRSAEKVTYQLDDVAGLPAGTYSTYVWIQPVTGRTPTVSRVAIGFMNFQIGIATEEKMVATNCTQCHKDTIWHLDAGPIHPAPFAPDYCKACHDYGRYETGDGFANQGGTSLNGWSGFGAAPLSRRIHGVHFGRYLDYPEQIYAGNPDLFKGAIFPQDVRNCIKCHDPKGSPAWKENASRLACAACHDSDLAVSHTKAMTIYPNAADPWSNDRVETCNVCHGKDRPYSADKVHNVSEPYKPPYPREPEH